MSTLIISLYADSTSYSPAEIGRGAKAIHTISLDQTATIFETVLGDRAVFDRTQEDAFRHYTCSEALSILDPLVSSFSQPATSTSAAQCPSTFARLVTTSLCILGDDLKQLRSSAWLLEHVLLLDLAIKDALAVPEMPSPILGSAQDTVDLQSLGNLCDKISTYLVSTLSRSLGDDWQADLLKRSRSAANSRGSSNQLLLTLEVFLRKSESSLAHARLFTKVFVAALRYTDVQASGLEQWLGLAQIVASKEPRKAAAVLCAIRSSLSDSPRLHRYQNELASTVAGIKPTDMHTKGLSLLRQLALVAPAPDSSSDFVPQQRAIFLLQALQKWFTSEEDGVEEPEARTLANIARIICALAPVLQNLGGAHWDFMFDVVENVIEETSWSDASSLPGLWHACRFISTVDDLCSANSELRQTCKSRLDKLPPKLLKVFSDNPGEFHSFVLV